MLRSVRVERKSSASNSSIEGVGELDEDLGQSLFRDHAVVPLYLWRMGVGAGLHSSWVFIPLDV